MILSPRYLILTAAMCGACLAAIPVKDATAQDVHATEAPLDDEYLELIRNAIQKGDKLTREEYDAIMEKNREWNKKILKELPQDTDAVEKPQDKEYTDLIQKARQKGFKLSREEYDAIVKKSQERAGSLKKDIQESSLGAGELARRKGRTVVLELIDTEPLVKGKASDVTLRASYEDNGDLVTIDRLQVYHTKPIHVMINEPQLNDYTHAHPVATDQPAEYRFTFTPQTDCSYRAWVDIYPYDGTEQTAMVDVPGAKDCRDLPIDKTISSSAENDGYQFILSMNTKELAKDQDTTLFFNIQDQNGEDFDGLQPVMGAYAHLVGFRSGFDGVAHVHPMGDKPMSDQDRGGPKLAFHVRPQKAGYMRFYLQVLINDQMRFIPFGVNVAEEGEFSGRGLRELMEEAKKSDAKRAKPSAEESPMNDAHDADHAH